MYKTDNLNMKKILISMAAIAIILAGCDKENEAAPAKNSHRIIKEISWYDINKTSGYEATYNYENERVVEVYDSFYNGNIKSPNAKCELEYQGDKVVLTSSFHSNEKWIINSKSEMIFQNGNLIKEAYYSYKEGNWELSYKETYSYNGSKLISFLGEDLNYETLEMYESSKAEVFYNGNEIKQVDWYDKNEQNEWINDYRSIYSYSNGNVTEIVDYYIEEGVLLEDYKQEFSFNSEGKVVESLNYGRNAEDSDWTDDPYLGSYIYNADGYLISQESRSSTYSSGDDYTYEEGHGNAFNLFYNYPLMIYPSPKSTSKQEKHKERISKILLK
jgi:hypothetical protein